MKKLLGLLAVAPMALAACGPAAAEKVETAYFLGHGKYVNAQGVNGAQNDQYNVIQIDLFEDGDKLSYEVNESTGYQAATPTGDQAAVPVWTKDSVATTDADYRDSDQFATDKAAFVTAGGAEADFKTGDTDYEAFFTAWQTANPLTGTLKGEEILKSWPATAGAPGENVVANEFYANTGESLRYVYEAVEVAEANLDLGDDGFVNKSDDNYGNDGFVWDTNRGQWNAYLNKTYDTCKLVEAVTQAEVDTYASTKQSGATVDNGIAGSSAGEAGLYIAAALTTAKAHCA